MMSDTPRLSPQYMTKHLCDFWQMTHTNDEWHPRQSPQYMTKHLYDFWQMTLTYVCSQMLVTSQKTSNQSNQITLLSLKRICILQLMITSKIYGMVTTKCKWISRCIHYKNNSTGSHQYDSFSIQYSNGHRHKTPAIARCFTFYTTVSPLRWKYMEEHHGFSMAKITFTPTIIWICVLG